MADYLPECAASVLGQTLPETELILVDDGSTDGSERLAEAWQAAQPERVKVIHQPNRGPSAARNVASTRRRAAACIFSTATTG